MGKFTKIITVSIVSIVLLFVFQEYYAESDTDGPDQPVLFSHKIHAGDNEIACEYCHSYASISTNPGIPSMQKCMGCHSQIAGRDVEYDINGTTINIKNEIHKVKDYWSRQEPIPWVKVTTMPEFVRFNHKRHIKRGFECQTCHGPVQEMDVVYKAESLNMGFCISCHEQHADDEQHLTQLKDCLTCHY